MDELSKILAVSKAQAAAGTERIAFDPMALVHAIEAGVAARVAAERMDPESWAKSQAAHAELLALRKDAARYRWLKGRQGLTLRSEKQPNLWKRIDGTEFSATHSLAEGGTQHAPADSLDALIDAAMLAARIRDA